MDEMIEPSFVTVVNRMPDTREFMGFGRVHVFKPGEERAISRQFAEWVFTRTDGPMLAHTDQGYVHWLGIRGGDDELVRVLPESNFDCSPLVPVSSIEGWNTGVVEREPEKTKIKDVPRQRADFPNQGGVVGRGVMAAPARVKE